MSTFDRLHPALQHHVVNSLGWGELRPVQSLSIEGFLAGANLVVLAPTAGGKTEAAFFPVISQMLTEGWTGLSVLYVSPIRALLNNQEERLRRYFRLVGRGAACWHGDTTQGDKRRMMAEPPDCLLTTPESLEVLLVSTKIDHRRFFQNVRAVVIDELHAFAGDDRGWHLLSVLARVRRFADRDIQRIGLSATVGNPGEMLDWLSSGSAREKRVVRPEPTARTRPDVQLDYVGSLPNAAKVIRLLHPGQKRLVFCDSRSRVEQLSMLLRQDGVETFVSHSSLGLSSSRMGIYEHVGTDGPHVKLRELITEDEFTCHSASGYKGKKGELWFVRLLPPLVPELANYQIIFTTPYVLTSAGNGDWTTYLRRAMLSVGKADERKSLATLLKYGPDPNYWNEFVLKGYNGFQHDAIFLAGIPDVKGSLPHG